MRPVGASLVHIKEHVSKVPPPMTCSLRILTSRATVPSSCSATPLCKVHGAWCTHTKEAPVHQHADNGTGSHKEALVYQPSGNGLLSAGASTVDHRSPATTRASTLGNRFLMPVGGRDAALASPYREIIDTPHTGLLHRILLRK